MTHTQLPRRLVEFYDEEYLENILSLLSGEYAGITYVYVRGAGEPNQEDRDVLSAFIEKRFGFLPDFLEIPEDTIGSVLEKFRTLISDDGLYTFDITGGSPVFIAAVGALLSGAGGDRVSVHEYDIAAGTCHVRYPAAMQKLPEKRAALTVSEALKLRGIRMLDLDEAPIRYDLNDEGLRGEILRLWSAIRGELRAWNSFSVLPAEYTQMCSGLLVEKRMSSRQYASFVPLLDELSRHKILSDLKRREEGKDTCISFRLQVPESAYVLYQKAGNLLEMLTYLAIVDSGHFEDCCTGVKLDWDDRTVRWASDPFNEIDTIATRGYISYFISCKNTGVKNDFLYEIMTMTRHFGGAYAVPVLLSTMECGETVRVRAKEMGIILIDNICTMTVERFSERLCAALSR